MYSFVGRRSKLEPDSPFGRKPMKLFQKVGECKRRQTSGLLRDTLASACCARCRQVILKAGRDDPCDSRKLEIF